MFYDLNIPWTSARDPELPRTLAFLAELGYDVVALNHTLTGKLPAELECAIPSPLPFAIPPKLTILRRLTLPLTTPINNARLRSLASGYDILALRPSDEKNLQSVCSAMDCDIISIDLTQRLGYHFRFKMLADAARRGVRFEICYAGGLVGDSNARRNTISNVTGLVRASRGRGLLVTSEAKKTGACRAPWDVVNLLAVWGLKQEIAFEAVSKDARSVVVQAGLKRSGWRGVVDVVYGGEDEPNVGVQGSEVAKQKGQIGHGTKRKAETVDSSDAGGEKPLSKREMKRRAKKARDESGTDTAAQSSAG
ncbi:PHP domain-like protein [Myriangium duriaei CBS 260.36]|uniref:PHP domain-like protein n=1 Tax=Myriangium duriaei CBS 260.36 TaxID=1168546 RepID=A0A9P4MK17_9PEZI|nr:PHP domain-like protein [Myriangium duriaei CBS 260.36]